MVLENSITMQKLFEKQMDQDRVDIKDEMLNMVHYTNKSK